LIAEVVYVEL